GHQNLDELHIGGRQLVGGQVVDDINDDPRAGRDGHTGRCRGGRHVAFGGSRGQCRGVLLDHRADGAGGDSGDDGPGGSPAAGPDRDDVVLVGGDAVVAVHHDGVGGRYGRGGDPVGVVHRDIDGERAGRRRCRAVVADEPVAEGGHSAARVD